VFLGSFCFIQDLANWNMIGLGKATRGLYLLQHRVPPPFVLTASSKSFSFIPSVEFTSFNADLWHFHLGHLSYAKFSLLNNLVSGLPANKAKCCDICHFSKQKRLSFPTSAHVSHCVFDLVHCDLWGPFSVPIIEGYKYFLIIMDYYSRCTWVYLFKSKSETQALIQQFSVMVETQFDTKIKCLRSDNGTKFIMKDIFKSKDILHQLSCVDTLNKIQLLRESINTF